MYGRKVMYSINFDNLYFPRKVQRQMIEGNIRRILYYLSNTYINALTRHTKFIIGYCIIHIKYRC